MNKQIEISTTAKRIITSRISFFGPVFLSDEVANAKSSLAKPRYYRGRSFGSHSSLAPMSNTPSGLDTVAVVRVHVPDVQLDKSEIRSTCIHKSQKK